jgi:hypothetical protein
MRIAPLLLALAALGGCASRSTPPPVARPPVPAPIEAVLQKQIYQTAPVEAGRYIAWVHAAEPDLRRRIAAIGAQEPGPALSAGPAGRVSLRGARRPAAVQPRAQRLRRVCGTHYAMALSRSREEFFWMLQRIRYRDGVIGVATRNRCTEMDWSVANGWLVTDVSAQLAGPDGPSYAMRVDRARFLKTRHDTERAIPVETSRQSYVPKQQVEAIASQLQEGDFVNVISTRDGEHWPRTSAWWCSGQAANGTCCIRRNRRCAKRASIPSLRAPPNARRATHARAGTASAWPASSSCA